jgi:hypothetical protein
MKKLKHRTNIYVVVRSVWNDSENKIVLVNAMDAFRTYERAEEMKGVYEQQDAERNVSNREYKVDISTFYDE